MGCNCVVARSKFDRDELYWRRVVVGSGAHSLGYEEIVQGIVDEIAKHPARYPTIDTQRVIVQQLHRLSERQVRDAARLLMVRWGLVAAGSESG